MTVTCFKISQNLFWILSKNAQNSGLLRFGSTIEAETSDSQTRVVWYGEQTPNMILFLFSKSHTHTQLVQMACIILALRYVDSWQWKGTEFWNTLWCMPWLLFVA